MQSNIIRLMFLILPLSLCMTILFLPMHSFPQEAYAQDNLNRQERFTLPDGTQLDDMLPFVLSLNVTSHENNVGNSSSSGAQVASTIQLGLYSNKTGERVTGVAYYLALNASEDSVDNNQSGDATMSVIFQDYFYAEDGILTFDLAYGNESSPTIKNGYREGFLNALVVDSMTISNNNKLTLVLPMEIRGGEEGEERAEKFNLRVETFSMYGIRNVLVPEDVQKADFVLDTDSNTSTRVVTVPEFGTLAALIVAMGMASVLVASSCTGRAGRGTRQY